MPDQGRPPGFGTKELPAEPIVTAPDGSHVRELLSLPSGSAVHFEIAPGAVSRAGRHRTVDEIWFILAGRGEMWRCDAVLEEEVSFKPGVCLSRAGGRGRLRPARGGEVAGDDRAAEEARRRARRLRVAHARSKRLGLIELVDEAGVGFGAAGRAALPAVVAGRVQQAGPRRGVLLSGAVAGLAAASRRSRSSRAAFMAVVSIGLFVPSLDRSARTTARMR